MDDPMTVLSRLLVDTLAAWTLSRYVRLEKIGQPVRRLADRADTALIARTVKNGAKLPDYYPSDWLACPVCLGQWTTFATVILGRRWPRVVHALAVGGLVGYITDHLTPNNDGEGVAADDGDGPAPPNQNTWIAPPTTYPTTYRDDCVNYWGTTDPKAADYFTNPPPEENTNDAPEW